MDISLACTFQFYATLCPILIVNESQSIVCAQLVACGKVFIACSDSHESLPQFVHVASHAMQASTYLTKAARAGLPLSIACLAISANDTEQDDDCNFSTITLASSSPSNALSLTLQKQIVSFVHLRAMLRSHFSQGPLSQYLLFSFTRRYS